MNSLTFEWDAQKNEPNKRKHGVDFEEAQTVFHDENAKYMTDPDHSLEEDRYSNHNCQEDNEKRGETIL